MSRYCLGVFSLALLAGITIIAAGPGPAGERAEAAPVGYPFVFRDVGTETGLLPAAAGVRAHCAAWGDVDGDGYPDLFLGTFHAAGSKTSLFLRNDGGKFRLDGQEALRLSSCASGAAFVDLDNRGRLDLYVSNNAHGKSGATAAPSALFRNDGGGRFTDVSRESGACPPRFMGRTVAAADFDGDGLLDLVVCEFYYGTRAGSGLALYRNLGNFRFRDVARASGLPTGAAVSGLAVADVNGDGWPDLFLTFPDGSNRLFLNDGRGHFREAPGTRAVFAWKNAGPDDAPTGVCLADVNRDGLPDVVIGHHFKTPWRNPAPVRLYLHRGLKDGSPSFEDVTEAAGLTPLAMKAPHVEVQDFDNDGWPDLAVSIVKFHGGKPYPVIFKNLGVKDGIPRFRDDAWAVNDFPTAADRSVKRTTAFFEKMLRERKVIYAAAGPSVDFDRDGRLDFFLANWWVESPPLLLRNETPGGNWLQVQVRGGGGVNRMGVGAKVKVYPAGKLGEAAALLGRREIAVGFGWCSGQEAVAHFGLGQEAKVDLEVTLPHGKGTLVRKDVRANQRITVQR
jgi:hypothetical protein